MALQKEIPERMTELGGTPWHDRVLEYNTVNRCKEAYEKINYEHWPVERTCMFFAVSSVWYRNQAMRYSLRWNENIVHERKMRQVYMGFNDRVNRILDIKDEWDNEAFYDALFGSEVEKKIVMDDEDEWVDTSPVTDEDILSLKGGMIAARKVIDERHKRIEERAQEAKE